jgi:hypothetical protein
MEILNVIKLVMLMITMAISVAFLISAVRSINPENEKRAILWAIYFIAASIYSMLIFRLP